MEYRHYYDEIMKHFGEGRPKDAGGIQNDLHLHDVNINSYYTDKYAFWLDFQTIDDNKLHGSGRSSITNNKESLIIRQIVLLSVYIPECSNLHFRCSAFECHLLTYELPKISS